MKTNHNIYNDPISMGNSIQHYYFNPSIEENGWRITCIIVSNHYRLEGIKIISLDRI